VRALRVKPRLSECSPEDDPVGRIEVKHLDGGSTDERFWCNESVLNFKMLVLKIRARVENLRVEPCQNSGDLIVSRDGKSHKRSYFPTRKKNSLLKSTTFLSALSGNNHKT